MIESSSSTPQPPSTPQADLVIPESFDYTSLTAEMAQQARATAQCICQRIQRTVADILSIGQELLAVKEALPHGRFGPWLRAEFGWTERTARHFMTVAERFGSQADMLSDCRIEATAAYLLAAPSAPQEAVEEALARARNGERITASRAREILAKLRGTPNQNACRARALPTAQLLGPLLATLESFRHTWEPRRYPLLAREIRDFADSLKQTHPRRGKQNRPDADPTSTNP
jgi:hypothetical protein